MIQKLPRTALLTTLLIAGCQAGDRGALPPPPTSSQVALTPFSGRYGFAASGPLGFEGSLTRDDITDARTPWKFAGQFEFPTGGYSVGEPEVAVAESFPEQVSVTIPVAAPGTDQTVTQALEQVPVAFEVHASAQAAFDIKVRTRTAP